jgi:alpha-galactosidase
MNDPVIVLLDSGDPVHGARALGDVFSLPIHLRGSRVVLVDDDAAALDRMARYAQAINLSQGELFTFEATTERREALRAAEYVVQLPLYEASSVSERDWRLPLRHGVRHIAGRSGGPGGLSRTLRLTPRLLERARDVEEIAPRALYVNQAEPLGRTCTVLARHTRLRWVGAPAGRAAGYGWLSRAFGWTRADRSAEQTARDAARRVRARAAGLPGLSFFVSLRDRLTGDDMYPRLRERLAAALPDFELLSRRLFEIFGLYCASGDAVAGEFLALAAETTPLHGPDLDGEARVRRDAEEHVRAVGAGEIQPAYGAVRASSSRALPLIAAMINDLAYSEPALVLPNEDRIHGLPADAAVETPAFVTGRALRGEPIAELPAGILALLQREATIAALAVDAAAAGDRSAALQALLLDSHIHSYAQATHLLDDALDAHRAQLSRFA